MDVFSEKTTGILKNKLDSFWFYFFVTVNLRLNAFLTDYFLKCTQDVEKTGILYYGLFFFKNMNKYCFLFRLKVMLAEPQDNRNQTAEARHAAAPLYLNPLLKSYYLDSRSACIKS